MSDAAISVTTVPNAAERRFFGLPLTAEEKSKNGLLRAICLRIAFLGLLTYCAYSTAMVIATSWALIGNQWSNTYPEAPQIYAAIRTALGGKLYYPLTERPYILAPYGPLYYEMNAWTARIVHADVDRFIHFVRLTSFAAFIACGFVLFLICRRLKFSRSASLAAALLPLGVPFFCPWAVTVRPDMYFLALMLGSLLVAVWNDSPSGRACFGCGALGGLAFLVKQPGVSVLIAIAVVWLARKEFRRTLLLAGGALLPVVLMLAFLLVKREPFLAQFFAIGKAIQSASNGHSYSLYLLADRTRLLPIGIGLTGLVRALGTGKRGQMIASFTIINWAIGFAGMSQLGAGTNYFCAGLLGCGLLLPFAFESVREYVKFAPILLLVGIGAVYLASGYSISGVLNGVNLNPNSYWALGRFHILSDRPELTLRGRDPDLLDPISDHNLEIGGGGWSSAPIVQNVRNNAYDLVILACSRSRVVCNFRGVDFFAPVVVDAINANYSVFCTSSTAIVLTPRSRQVNVTTDMLSPALGAVCETTYQGHTPDLIVLRGTR